jgi:hypothetical protein
MNIASQVIPWIFGSISLAVAFASLVWAIYLKGSSNRVHVTDKHDDEIAGIKALIQGLQLAQARNESPLLKQVQDLLTAGLHHPDPSHARQDYLLEKLDKTTLTSLELPELEAFLNKQIASINTPKVEVEAARALKAIMPLVVKETAITESVVEEMKKKEDK